MKRFPRIIMGEILTGSGDVDRILQHLGKDLEELRRHRLIPVAVVIDSDSLSYLISSDKANHIILKNRYYWHGIPIYVDHLSSFRVDVLGEPQENTTKQEHQMIYDTFRSYIRQGMTKEDLYELIDECLVDDLFS